jgi:hypothetical protein
MNDKKFRDQTIQEMIDVMGYSRSKARRLFRKMYQEEPSNHICISKCRRSGCPDDERSEVISVSKANDLIIDSLASKLKKKTSSRSIGV